MKIAVDGANYFVVTETIGTIASDLPLPQIYYQQKELSVYHDHVPAHAHAPDLCLCLDLCPYHLSLLNHEASEFGLHLLFDRHDQY